MRFGSVCSGIEAASVAWHPLGWKAAWLSEIEPFPSAVLKHHYPDVPNLGDMTALPERILSGEVEAPDVFCGGTPCQAFSVAGLRNSLDDARGNLSLTFVGIANAIDHVRSVRSDSPAIIFWENVPGVLSTKDNAFGCFLGALAGEDDPVTCPDGKWPTAGVVVGQKRAVAWRVLDAQYFGVAQRRRRVFVVASARDDFDPAAVLFEFDGLRRDTAPSREAWKETTTGPASGLDVSHTGTLTAGFGKLGAPEIDAYTAIPVISPCLETQAGGLRQPCTQAYVAQPITFGMDGDVMGDVMETITTREGNISDTAHAVMQPTYAIQGSMIGRNDNAGPQGDGINEEVCFTQNCVDKHGVATPIQVRRLTPVECERLQGFPDNYTNIPWRNKPESPDGPRYKALGNSWAVPVVHWIGKRINEAVK